MTLSKFTNFVKKVKKARELATNVHDGQFRRGLDDDGNKVEYINHPIAVAKLVHKVKNSSKIADLIAAAYLHDCIEDCEDEDRETVEKRIKEEFGELVYSLVKELSSDPEELEKLGKEKYLTNKMLRMSSWGLVIKLADRVHNLSDIKDKLSGSKSDIKWAIKYSLQTKNIIDKLEKNRDLSSTQKKLISIIKNRIKPALDLV